MKSTTQPAAMITARSNETRREGDHGSRQKIPQLNLDQVGVFFETIGVVLH
jgi:hypothetical protein